MGPKMLEGWLGLSAQNVISRSVRDTALLLQRTQGPEAGGRTGPQAGDLMAALAQPPKPLRIALMLQNPFGAPVHPDCLDAAQAAARCCESLGHHVEIAAPQLAIGDMFASMGVATAVGMLTTVKLREQAMGRAAREDEFEPLNWRSLQLARGFSAEQAFMARLVFDQAARTLDLFLADFDLILSPVTSAPAPVLGAMSLDQPYGIRPCRCRCTGTRRACLLGRNLLADLVARLPCWPWPRNWSKPPPGKTGVLC